MKRKAIAFALAAALMGTATTASALIDDGYYALYYSDATFTTVVGDGGIECFRNNRWMNWGIVTPYYVVYERLECDHNPPPPIRTPG